MKCSSARTGLILQVKNYDLRQTVPNSVVDLLVPLICGGHPLHGEKFPENVTGSGMHVRATDGVDRYEQLCNEMANCLRDDEIEEVMNI
ncbi:unnamed protein product [Urochloa humidicola]